MFWISCVYLFILFYLQNLLFYMWLRREEAYILQIVPVSSLPLISAALGP